MITAEQIAASTGATILRCASWLYPLSASMDEFEINTPQRMAMFLAQCGHESGGLVFVRELWRPTAAQEGYEGRADLGNTQTGDGFLYRGRGLIQVTGRANYAAMAMALDIDCLNHPELLEQPVNAARSAGQFWKSNGLNEIADSGDFIHCTRIINGGTNGLQDRQKLYKSACLVLGVT